MGASFIDARVTRVVEFSFFISYLFYLKHIDRYYYNNLILESLFRKWLVTPRAQIINSLGFKTTMSGGVKGFHLVSKTSRLTALKR
jgi:hypothetical protein